MQAFQVEATDDSPKVVLDNQSNLFLLEGESRPQHTFKFYQPVIEWLEAYKNERLKNEKDKEMVFQVNLSYFNSTSAKFLGDILFLLDSYCESGANVLVKWFYIEEDIDMKETAEEYQKLLKKLKIQLEIIQ